MTDNLTPEIIKIKDEVIAIIAQRLGLAIETVDYDSDLYKDLNASKLEIADIIQSLEDKFQIKFDFESINTFTNIASITEYITDNVD